MSIPLSRVTHPGRQIHEQILFSQHLLSFLPFIPCRPRVKTFWVPGTMSHLNESHPSTPPTSSPSLPVLSPMPIPPPAITQPMVRDLPRGVGTDKGFHGFLVHKAWLPPTAQLAGSGPHKLQRTQGSETLSDGFYFNLGDHSTGSAPLEKVWLYLLRALGAAAMLSTAIRIDDVSFWNG